MKAPLALVVPGHSRRRRISATCRRLVVEAEHLAELLRPDIVVFSGWSPGGGVSEAEQMRALWRGPDLELVVEPTAATTAQNAVRTLPLLLERGVERVVIVCAPLHRYRACDVAVGSRFVSGEGYEPYRYRPSPARRLGTALLRRGMRITLQRPFADATSGLYAVNAKALPILAEPFRTEAPEVEALIRLNAAGLRVDEVPVTMEARAAGLSKLRGRKAVKVTLTVVGTLVASRFLWSRSRTGGRPW